ncbi:hypothetical protein [Geodermatophilus sp. SYSU D01176]
MPREGIKSKGHRPTAGYAPPARWGSVAQFVDVGRRPAPVDVGRRLRPSSSLISLQARRSANSSSEDTGRRRGRPSGATRR